MTVAALGVGVGTPVAAQILRRRGVVDRPNDRSSHALPTVRGAGLVTGPVMAVGFGLGWDNLTLTFAVVTLAATFLGGLEDLRGLRPGLRLATQTVIAVVFISATWRIGRPLAWPVAAITLVFIVGYTNAFNFMDGINGISAATAGIAGMTFVVLASAHGLTDLLLVGAVLGVSAIVFLPFNFPVARIFLGDSGSYSFGIVIACAAVTGWRAGLRAESVLAPLAIYLADSGTTLLSRALRRESLFEPHLEHVYQRLVRLGASHVQSTSVVAAFTAASASLGLLSAGAPTPARLALDSTWLAVVGSYLAMPRFVEARRRQGSSRSA